MAKKKTTKKKTAKKTKKRVDPVSEQIARVKPKCEDALKQARAIVGLRFASVDSVFRHRLDSETQRNIMDKAGAGYLAFQALLELTRDINRLVGVPVDCEDLTKEFKKLAE